jgi:hypothetical protein
MRVAGDPGLSELFDILDTPGNAAPRATPLPKAPTPAPRSAPIFGDDGASGFEDAIRHLAPLRQHFLAQVAAVPANANVEQKLDHATNIAGDVLTAMGYANVDLRVIGIHGTDIYAQGRLIHFGADVAAWADIETIAEIILHEAGHIMLGHTVGVGQRAREPGINASHAREFEADTFAALGAFLFDRYAVPGLATYLESLGHGISSSHPAGAERGRAFRGLIKELDRIAPGAQRSGERSRYAGQRGTYGGQGARQMRGGQAQVDMWNRIRQQSASVGYNNFERYMDRVMPQSYDDLMRAATGFLGGRR